MHYLTSCRIFKRLENLGFTEDDFLRYAVDADGGKRWRALVNAPRKLSEAGMPYAMLMSVCTDVREFSLEENLPGIARNFAKTKNSLQEDVARGETVGCGGGGNGFLQRPTRR